MHDLDKRMVIKSMVRKHKPDLVCFQEIKMKEMPDRIVRSLGIGRNLGWVSLDARGSAGGVLVMWDKRVLEGLEVEVGSFLFHAALEIARRVLFGFSLGYMARSKEGRGGSCGRS